VLDRLCDANPDGRDIDIDPGGVGPVPLRDLRCPGLAAVRAGDLLPPHSPVVPPPPGDNDDDDDDMIVSRSIARPRGDTYRVGVVLLPSRGRQGAGLDPRG
jgi:hypothetical protein